jgi:Cadherin-like domain/Bacterial Ig domain
MAGRHRTSKRTDKRKTGRSGGVNRATTARPEPYKWLGAGAVAFTVAMGLSNGAGIAHADADGGSDSSSSSSAGGSSTAGGSTSSSSGTSAASSSTDSKTETRTSTSSGRKGKPSTGTTESDDDSPNSSRSTETDDTPERPADATPDDRPEAAPDHDSTPTTPVDASEDGAGTDDIHSVPTPDVDEPDPDLAEPPAQTQTPAAAETPVVPARSESGSDSSAAGGVPAGQPGSGSATKPPETREVVKPIALIGSPIEPAVTSSRVGSAPSAAMTAFSAPAATASTTAVSVETRRAPVTLKSIVTEMLSWVGLGNVANALPLPRVPMGGIVESLWLFVRSTQARYNNQRPSATPTIGAGQDPTGPITGNLNLSDLEGDTLTVAVSVQPSSGSVELHEDGTFTYTPDPAATTGSKITFTVTIDDSIGNPPHYHGLLGLIGLLDDPVTATVTINRAPVAANDLASTNEDKSLTLAAAYLLANDSDADGQTVSITGVVSGANGTATFNGTSVTYTPNANFNGVDSFSYTISDGSSGTATGTVIVTVKPVNDAPAAVVTDLEVDDNGVVTGLITVTDPDGPELTVTPPASSVGPVLVSKVGDAAFSFTFTPTRQAHENAWVTPGDDRTTLTFMLSDGIANPVSVSVQAPITPIAPSGQGSHFSTIGLTDLDQLTGITVTPGGQVYTVGTGSLDLDGDGDAHGEDDYIGVILGSVDVTAQSFTPGALLGSSTQAYDVTVGPDGRLYVADFLMGVRAYDPANGFAATPIVAGAATQVAFGNDRMYVTNIELDPATSTATGSLRIFDANANQIGAPIPLADPSLGLAVGSDGHVYVTTVPFGPGGGTTGTLAVYTADGALVTTLTLPQQAYGLALDENDIAYVTAFDSNAVMVVDPLGAGLLGVINAPEGLLGIELGPDGMLYATDVMDRSVVVLDPADMVVLPPTAEAVVLS